MRRKWLPRRPGWRRFGAHRFGRNKPKDDLFDGADALEFASGRADFDAFWVVAFVVAALLFAWFFLLEANTDGPPAVHAAFKVAGWHASNAAVREIARRLETTGTPHAGRESR